MIKTYLLTFFLTYLLTYIKCGPKAWTALCYMYNKWCYTMYTVRSILDRAYTKERI